MIAVSSEDEALDWGRAGEARRRACTQRAAQHIDLKWVGASARPTNQG
jgi:hypothetical protein